MKQQQGSLLITTFSTLCNHFECKWHCRNVDYFKIWNLHFLLAKKFAWIEGNLQVLDLLVWLWEWCGFWFTGMLSTILYGQSRKRECEAVILWWELIEIELLVNALALLFLRQSKRKYWFSFWFVQSLFFLKCPSFCWHWFFIFLKNTRICNEKPQQRLWNGQKIPKQDKFSFSDKGNKQFWFYLCLL